MLNKDSITKLGVLMFRFKLKYKSAKGFTLMELLVVIAIISLLLSIILPSLRLAKRQAKKVICMSNLRQLAIAAFSYEADNQRLPAHFNELVKKYSNSLALPNMVGADTSTFGAWAAEHDVRLLYDSYVNVNFFNCPFLKDWDKSVNAVPPGTKRVYVDYFMAHGYWRNRDKEGNWAPKPWIKSSTPWRYMGNRMNVLLGDRLYAHQVSSTEYNVRVNHPGDLSFELMDRSRSSQGAWLDTFYMQDFSKDIRGKLSANYALKDGSVTKQKGSDDNMVDVELFGYTNRFMKIPKGF